LHMHVVHVCKLYQQFTSGPTSNACCSRESSLDVIGWAGGFTVLLGKRRVASRSHLHTSNYSTLADLLIGQCSKHVADVVAKTCQEKSSIG